MRRPVVLAVVVLCAAAAFLFLNPWEGKATKASPVTEPLAIESAKADATEPTVLPVQSLCDAACLAWDAGVRAARWYEFVHRADLWFQAVSRPVYVTAPAPRPVRVTQVRLKSVPRAHKLVQGPIRRSTPSHASGGVWDRVATCESGGNWSTNTGNGFYGGLQFTMQSWRGVGGTGRPDQASREEQISRAEKLQAVQGFGAWPVCSRKAGAR